VGAGGHRGRCRYAFSNADPKSNANTNSLACCVRIVRDPNNYSNRNLDGHRYCNGRRYCDSNCYLYADSHSNGHGYCNCHGHQHANSNSDCDRNA
jgi:ABC-type nickel/cobalt efflux system permease component RcnA